MKKLGVLILVVLLLTGCTTGHSVKDDTITIGWIGALSGDVASLGINNMRGIQIAVDEINAEGGIQGKKVNVIFEDDQYTERLTRNIYHEMTKLNNIDIVMTWTYTSTLSLASEVDNDNNILINSVDTSEDIANAGENVFAPAVYDEGIGITLANFIPKEKKVGVIFNNGDAFPVLVKDAFIKQFTKNGGKIIFESGYNLETTDFKSNLIKAENIDYLVILGWDEAGIAVKQARELGIKAQIVGMDTFVSENFYENSKGLAKGAHFSYWESPNKDVEKIFVNQFTAKYGEKPDNMMLAASGHDTMNILAEAMRKSDGSVDSIKKELYGIKNHKGLLGDLTMDSDGIVRSVREEMYQLTGPGEFVKV